MSADKRREMALEGRRQSKEHQMSVAMEITDVNANAVTSALGSHGVNRLIHGHTHRPAIHDNETPTGPSTRIVLGDWYEQGSVLRVSEQGYDLASL